MLVKVGGGFGEVAGVVLADELGVVFAEEVGVVLVGREALVEVFCAYLRVTAGAFCKFVHNSVYNL